MTAPKAKKQETYHGTFLPLDSVFPSAENEKLYRPINPADPDINALASSIRTHGVQQPLGVTQDGYLFDGHRRHAAARLAGLKEVPCRVEPFAKEDDHDRFMTLLVECNRQRVKSLDEQLREAVVEADPDEAYDALIEHRQQEQVSIGPTLTIRGGRPRAKLSAGKRPFLEAARKIVFDLRKYWPLSDRRIHYLLANDPPLIHAAKPRSRYGLNKESYRALTRLLTAARFEGSIPWEAIGDETRPVTLWRTHTSPAPFLREQLGGFLKNYFRNLQSSQPAHVEIMGEKNTIGSIIRPVASEYTIPVTLGRGFCSSPPRHDMAVRFQQSGKDRLVVLFIVDFDPPGMEIAHSFARSMQEEFYIDDVKAVKVALTFEQAQELRLRSGGKVKPKAQGARRFLEEYGDDVYELEAVPPETLQQWLREAIDSVIDIDRFNAELDAERKDAMFLSEARQRMHLALAGIVGTSHDDE